MVAKDEVASVEEVDSTNLTKGTQTFGNRTEAIKEPSEEGGASMPKTRSENNAIYLQLLWEVTHREEESHYYVTFIDDYSRYTWIFPMKRKSEVLDSHFQKLKSQVEKETGGHIR